MEGRNYQWKAFMEGTAVTSAAYPRMSSSRRSCVTSSLKRASRMCFTTPPLAIFLVVVGAAAVGTSTSSSTLLCFWATDRFKSRAIIFFPLDSSSTS